MTDPIVPIPRTDEGWPYVTASHPIPDLAAYSQDLAAALADFAPSPAAPPADTGWQTVTPAAGITGTILHRRIGAIHEVRFAITGSLIVGNTTIATLAAAQRPTQSASGPSLYVRTGCWLSAGTVGIVHLSPDGVLIISNSTGATRTAAEGHLIYT